MAELDTSVQALLQGKNFAFISTVNADGSPHVAPTWVDIDGNYVLINTGLGTVKQTNLKRDPRVTIAITEQTNPYNLVIIRGYVVEQTTGPKATAQLDRLAKKYMGLEEFPDRQLASRQATLKIKPERVFTRKT
jgi:PPOX class probable F420-dependent enzyme